MTPMQHSGKVLTFGEGLGVLRATDTGSLAQLPELAIGTGGAECNVAIGLSRLGCRATWLGRLGDDGLGRRVAREMRAEGVNVVAITDSSATTGLLLKETPYPGRTEVTYYRSGSAGSMLRPEDLDLIDFTDAALLHLTGITPSLSFSAAQTVDRALDLAQAHGVPVSFDVNHRSRLWSQSEASPIYRQIAKRASLVFAGDDEAELLVGCSGLDHDGLARAVADLGPKEVIIKRGSAGATVLNHGEVCALPAMPVPVVDTVGAGDAFVAGYIAEWLSNSPTAGRLATAIRTGAAACRHAGDWEGAATRSVLAQFDQAGDPVAR